MTSYKVTDAQDLLNEIYELSDKDENDLAIDILFEAIDDSFLLGDFISVDNLITSADIEKLNSYTAVGILSITLAAKEHLYHRAQFLEKAKEKYGEHLFNGL